MRLYTAPNGNPWAQLGFEYFMAFLELEEPLRVLQTGPVLADLGDRKGRWWAYRTHFDWPIAKEERCLNFVCGPRTQLDGAHSSFYRANIALLDGNQREALEQIPIDALLKYDEVWWPSWNSLNRAPREIQHRARNFVVPMNGPALQIRLWAAFRFKVDALLEPP
jgi:hypothetical protein